MSLRSAAAHRNLLYLLSLKELRTRYKKSIMGWAWSLLNPLTQMVIFSIIFLKVFIQPAPIGHPSGIANFPLFFLCGLLPFNFFSISVGVAMGNVQGGSGLIKKVSFPHEHLVFSVVIAQFITMLIEFVVLSVALIIAGNMVLQWIPVLLLILLLLSIFTTGLALALSAANVFFHDVNYLWGILAQLLFYASPIIYDANNPRIPKSLRMISAHGPTGSFITSVRNVMYDLTMPSWRNFAAMVLYAAVSFAFGAFVFTKLSPRFAEEM
ncbi:MAG TPA: ABC transporter permease [Ilumatobacteraceae bacterium]|nr:ABC transporter permease [Ilumatobacteraceae bacterium]